MPVLVPDVDGPAKGFKHPAEDMGEQKIQRRAPPDEADNEKNRVAE